MTRPFAIGDSAIEAARAESVAEILLLVGWEQSWTIERINLGENFPWPGKETRAIAEARLLIVPARTCSRIRWSTKDEVLSRDPLTDPATVRRVS